LRDPSGLGAGVEVVDRPAGDQHQGVLGGGRFVRGQVLGGLEDGPGVGVEGPQVSE
jgi:hypothetical protein